jgi:hypothetical protein
MPASALASATPFSKEKLKGELELVVVHDPELTRENPVESKYLKLMRYNRLVLSTKTTPSGHKQKTCL